MMLVISFDTLQHTTTPQHTATLQHTAIRYKNATHCNTLQQTEAQGNTLHIMQHALVVGSGMVLIANADAMQHAATLQHCNILQHTATHCKVLYILQGALVVGSGMVLIASCYTLQPTATHCNTLHHCNTLQRTAYNAGCPGGRIGNGIDCDFRHCPRRGLCQNVSASSTMRGR